MSDSYFTNRQDRYIIFRNSPELANFVHEIVNNVQTHSYKLTPENTLTPFSKFDPVTCSLDEFRESIVGATEKILQKYMENNNKVNSSSSQNALVFPLLQMGCFNYRHDETLTAFLISSLNKNDTTWIASGYFNFPAKYQSLVLNSPSSFNILTASPKANGFYGAKGIPGLVPNAYTHIESNFFHAAKTANRIDQINLFEYYRENWTFHGKGLWVYPDGESLPTFCLIGSPNFGFRSVYRDIEAQVGIFLPQENAVLRKQFDEEKSRLFIKGDKVTEETFKNKERYVSPGVAITTNIIKSFF